MNKKLKPCRRCGLYVSPDGIEVTQTDTGTYTARFECPDCGEVAETCMRHSSEDFAVADVIDDWNRRWIDPALTAEIEGLKDTILKLTGRKRFLGDETSLYAAHKETVAYKDKRIKELKKFVEGVLAIMQESTGIVGYHLNGDIATWDELGLIEEATELREGR